jgi:hypothetical protein
VRIVSRSISGIFTFRYSIIFSGITGALYQCFCLDPAMGLNVPDPYINALILPEMGGLQHLKGLSDPGNVPEENFEFAPVLLPLFALDMGKQRIGIRATFRKSNHRFLHSYENEQHINDLYSDERGNKPTRSRR